MGNNGAAMPFAKGDQNINRRGRPKGSGKRSGGRSPYEPGDGPACTQDDVLSDMLAVYGDPLAEHIGMRKIHQEMLRKAPHKFLERLTELQERRLPEKVKVSAVPAGPDEGSVRVGELVERLLKEREDGKAG